MSVESNERVYKCENCEYETIRLDAYKRHLHSQLHKKRSGETIIKRITVYECENCEYKTDRKFNLMRHIENEHINKKVICEYCDKTCEGEKEYKIHQKSEKHEFKLKMKLAGYNGKMKKLKKIVLEDLKQNYLKYGNGKIDDMPKNFNIELYDKIRRNEKIYVKELLYEMNDDKKKEYFDNLTKAERIVKEIDAIKNIIIADDDNLIKKKKVPGIKLFRKKKIVKEITLSESKESDEDSDKEFEEFKELEEELDEIMKNRILKNIKQKKEKLSIKKDNEDKSFE